MNGNPCRRRFPSKLLCMPTWNSAQATEKQTTRNLQSRESIAMTSPRDKGDPTATKNMYRGIDKIRHAIILQTKLMKREHRPLQENAVNRILNESDKERQLTLEVYSQNYLIWCNRQQELHEKNVRNFFSNRLRTANNGFYSKLVWHVGKSYICKQNHYSTKFLFTIFLTFTSPKPSQVKYNIYVPALYINTAKIYYWWPPILTLLFEKKISISDFLRILVCDMVAMLRKFILFPVTNNNKSGNFSKSQGKFKPFWFRGRSHLAVIYGSLEAIIRTNCSFIWSSVHLTVSLGISKPMALASLIKLMHVENWETDHLQHDLYVDISYKFTFAWVLVSHACTRIIINTCRNDLSLVLLLIVFTAALPPTISSTHHY